MSVCVEWMYTLYKFHFFNGISEINTLFDDILIIWPAPVYIYIYIYILVVGRYRLLTWQLSKRRGQDTKGHCKRGWLFTELCVQAH